MCGVANSLNPGSIEHKSSHLNHEDTKGTKVSPRKPSLCFSSCPSCLGGSNSLPPNRCGASGPPQCFAALLRVRSPARIDQPADQRIRYFFTVTTWASPPCPATASPQRTAPAKTPSSSCRRPWAPSPGRRPGSGTSRRRPRLARLEQPRRRPLVLACLPFRSCFLVHTARRAPISELPHRNRSPNHGVAPARYTSGSPFSPSFTNSRCMQPSHSDSAPSSTAVGLRSTP